MVRIVRRYSEAAADSELCRSGSELVSIAIAEEMQIGIPNGSAGRKDVNPPLFPVLSFALWQCDKDNNA